MKREVKFFFLGWASAIALILLYSLFGCASSKPSKHQNDSVADRLRQRHAPVKTHNPSIK